MSVGPVRPGIGIYSNIEDVVYKLYYKDKDFDAKQSWINADLLMSVGPFGPGGGIYSIIADAVYKVYFPNIRFGGPIYPLHTTSPIIEYIPRPGPTGPTDISKIAYIHNCLALSRF